jgi:hypothetical protein
MRRKGKAGWREGRAGWRERRAEWKVMKYPVEEGSPGGGRRGKKGSVDERRAGRRKE